MNLSDTIERPAGGYRIVYADPAWNFENWSYAGAGRAASRHYQTAGLSELCAMPVEALAAPDSVLFMWVSDPMLPEGLRLISSWGFAYKTVAFTWVKSKPSGAEHMGMGYYTRGNPEMCLLATRGHPPRPLDGGIRQLQQFPVREHSRKPDEIHGLIERMYPGPYVELFARTERKGWTSWGNETDKFKVAAE